MMGCQAIEVHVAMSQEMYGPDVSSSLTTGQLAQLVEGVRAMETMKAHSVDKDIIKDEMSEVRRVFSRSIVARGAIKAGTRLAAAHLALKKPGGGLAPSALASLLGGTLRRDLEPDEELKLDDVEIRGR